MRGLSGKRIIVAGSATGIGQATARRLHAEGAKVLLGDLNSDGVRDLAAELGAPWRAFDLANDESVADLVQASVSEFGGLDGLANIAGDVSSPSFVQDKDVVSTDLSIWERTLNINLVGYARLCQQAIPLLLEAGGGTIVNTTTAGAINASDEKVAYGASKAGVEALTRHVARTWGKQNIRCSAIAPGAVESERFAELVKTGGIPQDLLDAHMLPRLGKPDDVAAAISFLLSEDGEWVTGQIIGIDGGMAPRR